MRTILSIYMVDFLGFSETVGASLYHGFAALCYFTPVIGAIIADSFLGNIFSRSVEPRVSVQGVKSLGGHFACLCRGFEFYEVKKKLLSFFKKKMEILLHF